ncbi:MAG: DUF362 domain-containing protein [Desulfobacterales bacterium]
MGDRNPKNASPKNTSIDAIKRREFLIRCAKAGLSICAAGALSYWFYDPHGPQRGSPKQTAGVRLADFSISGQKPRMGIARGMDRTQTVRQAMQAVGGIETFVKPGDRVLLKVNAAFASPPALSATTHPQLVTEVTRLCLKAGAVEVIVTDNPINDPASCFALTGIARAAESAGGRVMLPAEPFFRTITLPGAQLIRNWPLLFEPFKSVNKLIGLAPVKDHHRSGASMTMKNWYGLLGGRRNIFHQDINTIIKELALMVKPTLVILDGTTSMVTNGPTGGSLSDLKETRTMIVSTDQVAADAYGASLIGKTAGDLPYIGMAAAAGAGTADYALLKPVFVPES